MALPGTRGHGEGGWELPTQIPVFQNTLRAKPVGLYTLQGTLTIGSSGFCPIMEKSSEGMYRPGVTDQATLLGSYFQLEPPSLPTYLWGSIQGWKKATSLQQCPEGHVWTPAFHQELNSLRSRGHGLLWG